MAFDLREIRQFIRFLSDTDVAEVEIKEEGRSLRITRTQPAPPPVLTATAPLASRPAMAVPAVALPSPAQFVPASSAEEMRETTIAITAPMVGTFYKAASPESAPFVKLGDMVKKGQVVCIIEAMKLMNEIESEVSGRVVSILKENATPVEYGEEMFLVEPG
ncbi:MAG: acetyl-CoA carboxylase biotin carboxyl carrier protein [Magnetococcales bacterium]|nr:acetyl-CoA carboxylase biotin carboxyl carrier protein [Magnetococcales bacterium]NGZ05530.1 acetyl-CoA carboxylase biotin carboxyl carrier protein [Magnetococcales bacterium]